MPKQILLVDDEPDILEELSELLLEEGYSVCGATGVDEALALYRTSPNISLVVTDMKMPGKSGLDLIEALQAESPRMLRYIILSGHAGAEIEGRDVSDCVVLKKPVAIDQLLSCVATAFL